MKSPLYVFVISAALVFAACSTLKASTRTPAQASGLTSQFSPFPSDGGEASYFEGNEIKEFAAVSEFPLSGSRVLYFSEDKVARVIDQGQLKTSFSISVSNPGDSNAVVSPDSERVLTFGGLDGGPTELWDLETGKLLKVFAMKSEVRTQWCTGACVWTAAFSSDGKRIFLGGYGDVVESWDIETNTMIRSYRPTRDWTNAVQVIKFSPDETKLIYADDNGAITVMDIATGNLIWESPVLSHGMTNMDVTFIDNHTIASSFQHGPIQVWDLSSHTPIRTFEACPAKQVSIGSLRESIYFPMRLSKDGKYLMDYSMNLEKTPAGSTTFPDICYGIWEVSTGKNMQSW